jgi:DNA-directed RNA polymerase subunit RPC12/RpoP
MCYAPLDSAEMTPEPACPRCSKVLSPEDTIERDGDRVAHVDCLQPRRLTREERVLHFQYCWDHGVVECVPCSRIFRQEELLASLFGDGMDRCPKCRRDLTDGIRAHPKTRERARREGDER